LETLIDEKLRHDPTHRHDLEATTAAASLALDIAAATTATSVTVLDGTLTLPPVLECAASITAVTRLCHSLT
jgi:hypothetical protein